MDIKLKISIISFSIIWIMETIFPHFTGRRQRLFHAVNNLGLALLNSLLYIILFSGITLLIIRWRDAHHFGMIHLYSFLYYDPYIKGIIVFLLFDLWMYIWHRINHRIWFFWRFHSAHHSDLDMDVTTAVRFHPIEIIFSSLIRLVVISLIGMSILHLLIYEISLQIIVQLHHSNISLPEKYDRLLRFVIVTPNMHRIHHSDEWKETNSNYSSIFAFWDRLWSSYREGKDTHTIILGLKILREAKWQGLLGILLTPFR